MSLAEVVWLIFYWCLAPLADGRRAAAPSTGWYRQALPSRREASKCRVVGGRKLRRRLAVGRSPVIDLITKCG